MIQESPNQEHVWGSEGIAPLSFMPKNHHERRGGDFCTDRIQETLCDDHRSLESGPDDAYSIGVICITLVIFLKTVNVMQFFLGIL
jgi:hypothetical protein